MRLAVLAALALITAPLAAEPRSLIVVGKAGDLGELEQINTDGSVVAGGQRIPLADCVAIRRTGVPVPPPPTGPQLVTSVGDRLPGTFLGCDETGVRFRAVFGEVRVPLSYAGVLWLVRPDSRLGRDPAWLESLRSARKRDLLLLRNRDVLTGTLIQMEPEAKGRIEVEGKVQEFDAPRVAAVAFNTALTRTRKPTKPYFAITLADGTRLHLLKCESDAKTVRGQPLFGGEVAFPIADLAEIRVMNGRAVYLSDLTPAGYDETPYLGARWEWSADSAWGEPLRLSTAGGVTTFDKGIALHSTSAIRYALANKYDRFEATVGVRHGRTGEAVMIVRVDGKDTPLTAGNVSIPVAGARELMLIVNHGPGGSVQDEVIWGNARLIRKD